MSSPPLQTNPLFRAADLGAPIPDRPHANSVCLPTWQDVVDYEEKRPRVMDRLRAGYPRFVVPPPCTALFERARAELGRAGEQCQLYPSPRAAARCAHFIATWSGHPARVAEWPGHALHAVLFPEAAAEAARKYWRHTGDGLSSRQAQALLDGTHAPDARSARIAITERIASAAGVSPNDVFLFPSGMAAIYTLHRAFARRAPGQTMVQFGFPYVDSLKILQDFGVPHVFFPRADDAEVAALADLARRTPPGGLFCEFPSNPVLVSTDLTALRELSLAHRFPITIDDTISSWFNVELLPACDVVLTSLTKWFTGRGDVMGGAAVLNPSSPFAGELRRALEAEYEDTAWSGALVLAEELSRDARARVLRATATATEIAAWLQAQPGVDRVFHPSLRDRARYDRFRRADGGYGGLFSFVLRDPERTSARFYDALELCKGPNLGTDFSLCCPFTLLAHYGELDWAESCGVPRWLLRLSVGQEPAAVLIERLARALASAS